MSLPRHANSSRLKGYCFVHFEDSEEGEKAAAKAITELSDGQVHGIGVKSSYAKRHGSTQNKLRPAKNAPAMEVEMGVGIPMAMAGMAGMAGIPSMAGMAGMAAIPGMPGIAGIPGMAGIPAIPGIPGMPASENNGAIAMAQLPIPFNGQPPQLFQIAAGMTQQFVQPMPTYNPTQAQLTNPSGHSYAQSIAAQAAYMSNQPFYILQQGPKQGLVQQLLPQQQNSPQAVYQANYSNSFSIPGYQTPQLQATAMPPTISKKSKSTWVRTTSSTN